MNHWLFESMRELEDLQHTLGSFFSLPQVRMSEGY
jgi:hypothetical protein